MSKIYSVPHWIITSCVCWAFNKTDMKCLGKVKTTPLPKHHATEVSRWHRGKAVVHHIVAYFTG